VAALLVAAALLSTCSSAPDRALPAVTEDTLKGAPAQPSAGGDPSPAAAAGTGLPFVMFLGDSITAGYGLAGEDAFPALVERSLEAEGLAIRMVNAGVSGDTTSGGLGRLDWLLRQEPYLIVVELGANDGLRGLPLEMIEKNLRQIITRCRESGARVLLTGMRIPPSYGPEYSEGFAAIFPRLADEMSVPLIPFLLEGVAGNPSLNLPDGIHPTAEGHAIVAATVSRAIEVILQSREWRSAVSSGPPLLKRPA